MNKTPVGRMVTRCVVAVGIVLSLLLAAGAPSDFGTNKTATIIQPK